MKIANLVYSRMLNLRVTCEIQKSMSGGLLCVFRPHTVVPISWMCKKQAAVSYSSAESEIISSDAVLRMDGLPALDLGECDLVVSSSEPAKGNLEPHTRKIHSVSFTFRQLHI